MTEQLVPTSTESLELPILDGRVQSLNVSVGFNCQQNHTMLDQNMNPPGRPSNRGMETPLALWYENNDGPWIPQGLTSGQDDARTSSRAPMRPHVVNFPPRYRGFVPSESDTAPAGDLPSDSGYGSYNARHSVANGSVCDEPIDRSQETQSLVGAIGDLGFQTFHSELISKTGVSPDNTWAQPQPQVPMNDRQIQLEPPLVCETCAKSLRTKSELRKHQQRHTKPFKCDVLDCPRLGEGFSTTNDLERHKRSVHPAAEALGNRYRCTIGSCKTKDKRWPRADNFKAHLKRVHHKDNLSENDLEQFIYRDGNSDSAKEISSSGFGQYNNLPTDQSAYQSSSWGTTNPTLGLPRDIEGPDLSRIRIDDTVSFPEHARDVSRLDISSGGSETSDRYTTGGATSSTQKTCSGSISTYDSQAPIGEGALDEAQSKDQGPIVTNKTLSIVSNPLDINVSTSSSDHSSIVVGTFTGNYKPAELPGCPIEDGKADAPHELDDLEIRGAPSLAVDLNNQNSLKSLLEQLQNTGMLKKLGYVEVSPDQQIPKPAESSASTGCESAHRCSRCKKTFSRKCELKKHEKRHEKPYGCTFQGCNKRFGSKNDWKRHENSQHFMLELWKCDEPTREKPSEPCGKVNRRREHFRTHLENEHNVHDQQAIDRKLETCRLGRNCEARFWCGFCRKIIEIKQKGLQAWTERFNHIDEHFSGKNNVEQKDPSEWINVDPRHPRPKSDYGDSDDAPVSPQPLLGSGAKAQCTSKNDGQYVGASKMKRKPEDGLQSSSKRWKNIALSIHLCCDCKDIMPVHSEQCMNFPCQHRKCAGCGGR
ncbi:hypothetical protein F5Y15DRAFT_4285 [Xylariaceae sp. FL0016]|nr:hypothetical protein F5Y15DRAFT_4285 [Xylariaceae sp. FL0016]